MRISYSGMDTFRRCPLKYKWQYLERIKVPPTQDQFFGSLIHEILEYALKKEPLLSPLEELQQYLERKWDKSVFANEVTAQIYYNLAQKILKTFHQQHRPGLTAIVNLEKFFKIPLDEHDITGKIDRVDKLPTGEFEIIDYKTNKNLPTQQEVDKNLQLALYQMAAQQLWPKVTEVRLTLYFLRHNHKITSSRSPKQIEELKKLIKKTVAEIEKSDYSPKTGPLCEWCEYLPRCQAGQEYLTKKQRNIETEQVKRKEAKKPRNKNDFPNGSLFSNLQ